MSRSHRLFIAAFALAPAGAMAVAACANSDPATPAANDDDTRVPESEASVGDSDASCESADNCAPALVDCANADFCAVDAPVPNLVSLNAVSGTAANDVWIVGTRGTILHGDGTSFTNVPSGTEAPLLSVCATAKDDVWIAAPEAPLHSSDGGGWEWVRGESWNAGLANEGRTWAVWGSSKDNVWMAGLPSSRFGGFGSFWSKSSSSDGGVEWATVDAYDFGAPTYARIRSVWGLGSDAIWAVGVRGQFFVYEAASDAQPARWSGHNSNTVVTLESVWASSATDIWAVGEGGVIRHSLSDGSGNLQAVTSPTTVGLHGVWGSSPNDVWAVGDRNTLLHYDGTAWTLADTGLPASVTRDLFGVWGSGPDDVWIAGESIILHRTTKNRRRP